jgi:hypothetical protein
MSQTENSQPQGEAARWLAVFEVALGIDGVDAAQAARVANIQVPPTDRVATRNILWADVNRS